MPLVVKDGGDFENHPQGQFRAICMDVVDLGMIENKRFGKSQHKVAIVFHSEAPMKDGRPFEVWERFSATLFDQARLRPFLESWRGQAFTADELVGFDLEKLIGVNALIQVIHNTSNGKTYANIKGIMLPPKGSEKLLPTTGYIRRQERPEAKAALKVTAGGEAEVNWPDEPDDDPDSLPF